jgi:hypothetical protein
MRVSDKQDPNLERCSSIIVENGAIVKDCRRIEKLRVKIRRS